MRFIVPYCPKCGIEVDYGIVRCPLCTFVIPEIPPEHDILSEDIELKNYYDELKIIKSRRKHRTKQITFIIILLIAIGAAINNTMQDWLIDHTLTFSPYVLSSLGLFTVFLISIFGFIKGWKKNLITFFLAITAFLFSIDFYAGGLDWFLPLGLPITVLGAGLYLITRVIINKLKPDKLYGGSLLLGVTAILLILLELILDFYSGEIKLEWSIQSIVPLGSLALLFILGRALINRDFFSKLKRYMHF